MGRHLVLLLLCLATRTGWSADTPEALREGLLSRDRALHLKDGWIRDPYITIGPDEEYYLTGTTKLPLGDWTDPHTGNAENRGRVGWKTHVWRSPDLIEWESLGSPFSLLDGVWAQKKPNDFQQIPRSEWRLWAPELHWLGDRWAVVHTSPSPVRGANLALTRGAELRGPWSQPYGTALGHRHDPSLFRNHDGVWWLVWNACLVAPLKADFSGFAADPISIGPSGEETKIGHEGCVIHHVENQYVLFGTGWSTGEMRKGSYNLYYATSDRLTGPYGPRRFAGRFLGHGTLFRDKRGEWWCTAFYNADRPPLTRDAARGADLGEAAQTINPQGTTIVPVDLEVVGGRVSFRVLDPDYASPGPDEKQVFPPSS